jgi:gluconolactonase
MKKSLYIFLITVISLLTFACREEIYKPAQTEKGETFPRITRLDERFNAIVPADAKLEKLTDGFGWTEGPVWDKKGNFLLFSDIPNNQIVKLQNGATGIFLKPSGYTDAETFTGREPGSNGLTFDAEGRLTFTQHGNRRVVRQEKTGDVTVLADKFEGKRLNSPNDLVYKSNGDLYFTDPPFGLPKASEDAGKELDFQGVYRLSKNGVLTLLTKEVQFPNGIAFAPDEKILYVSNADKENAVWYAFEVKEDGTLGEKKTIFNAAEWKNLPGVPDGLKVDKNGYLFAAAPGGIRVVDPQDGKLLGVFEFDAPTANCNWGEDGSVLYITSNTAIYRIKLNTKGANF